MICGRKSRIMYQKFDFNYNLCYYYCRKKRKIKRIEFFSSGFYSFLSQIYKRGDREMDKIVKVYVLYAIDKYGRPSFVGRYASKHRLQAAATGLGLTNWFYETDAKEDEFGGYININAALKTKVAR